MSKSNNLTEFLTDVAGAIRSKKCYPSTQKINPQNFSSEIESISSGVSPTGVLKFISVDQMSELANTLGIDWEDKDIYLMFRGPVESDYGDGYYDYYDHDAQGSVTCNDETLDPTYYGSSNDKFALIDINNNYILYAVRIVTSDVYGTLQLAIGEDPYDYGDYPGFNLTGDDGDYYIGSRAYMLLIVPGVGFILYNY